MRVAILASGPSLAAFCPPSEGGESFDFIIGVNRAATAHACDWWSVGDDQAFWRHLLDPDNEHHGFVIGRPRVLTMSPTWAAVYNNRRDLYDQFPEWMTWEKLRDLAVPPQEWDSLSSTVAVVLAGHLGAAEIHAFGMDHDKGGDADFAGWVDEYHGRYNPGRWANETRLVNMLVDWLRESKGCRFINRGQEALSHAA